MLTYLLWYYPTKNYSYLTYSYQAALKKNQAVHCFITVPTIFIQDDVTSGLSVCRRAVYSTQWVYTLQRTHVDNNNNGRLNIAANAGWQKRYNPAWCYPARSHPVTDNWCEYLMLVGVQGLTCTYSVDLRLWIKMYVPAFLVKQWTVNNVHALVCSFDARTSYHRWRWAVHCISNVTTAEHGELSDKSQHIIYTVSLYNSSRIALSDNFARTWASIIDVEFM